MIAAQTTAHRSRDYLERTHGTRGRPIHVDVWTIYPNAAAGTLFGRSLARMPRHGAGLLAVLTREGAITDSPGLHLDDDPFPYLFPSHYTLQDNAAHTTTCRWSQSLVNAGYHVLDKTLDAYRRGRDLVKNTLTASGDSVHCLSRTLSLTP